MRDVSFDEPWPWFVFLRETVTCMSKSCVFTVPKFILIIRLHVAVLSSLIILYGYEMNYLGLSLLSSYHRLLTYYILEWVKETMEQSSSIGFV